MKNRIITFIIFAVFLSSLLSFSVLPLAALNTTYTVSDDYAASPFYEKLTSIKLTGDGRTDVVAVALSQIGYHEGDSEADFEGSNGGGTRNFVEYNRLHGKVDNNEGNGISYGYYWCASFSSWCLRQAGIPKSDICSEISCQRWVKWLTENSLYKTRTSGYIPRTGDVIFFKDAGSSSISTHVGIVRYQSDSTVYTIEGNSGGAVTIRSYALTDTYIVGYGVPEYKSVADKAIDFNPSASVSGRYIVTPSSLNVRSGIGVSFPTIGALYRGDVVLVTEIKNGWGKIDYNGKEGWISISYAGCLEKINFAALSFNANGGNAASLPPSEIIRTDVPFTLDGTIPTRDGYAFMGWSLTADSENATFRADASIEASDKDRTLYAVWKEQYTVSFTDENGEIISSKEYTDGDTIILPELSELEKQPNGELSADDYLSSGNTSPQTGNGAVGIIIAVMLVCLPVATLTERAFRKHFPNGKNDS